jgi:ketosteroid isomerase-like protein
MARRALEALNRRDIDAALEDVDPDIELVFLIMQAEGRSYRGHEGLRQYMDDVLAVFPNWRAEPGKISEHGDVVVVQVRLTGRETRSGVEVDQTVWQVVRFREGRFVHVQSYESEAEALEAVGLSE